MNEDKHGIRPGIVNMSNICYINSALQCLASSIFIKKLLKHYDDDDALIIKIIEENNLLSKENLTYNDNIKDLFKNLINNETNKITKKNIKIIEKKYNDLFVYITFKSIILGIMKKRNVTLNPNVFISVCKENTKGSYLEELFRGQNDPHEFVTYLLDKLHSSRSSQIELNLTPNQGNSEEDKIYNEYIKEFKMRNEKDFSFFTQELYYYILNVTKCSKCGHQNYSFSPNNHILSLTIKKQSKISIFNCLDELFSTEILEEGYKCDKCKNDKMNIIEKKILSKPKDIVLQLNRFETDMFGNSRKINDQVDYPLDLNINNYCLFNNQSNNYILYGVINHQGSINSGHYYSFTRDINYNNNYDFNKESGPDNQIYQISDWYLCNDEHVSPIKTNDVLNNSNAYMLFYQLVE